MTGQALGLIEAVGLPAAVAAADAAVKAANVKLLGYELTKGGGLVTVKLIGDVAAVRAAVDAGAAEARRVHGVWATHIIPRPAEGTKQFVRYEMDIEPEEPVPETAETEKAETEKAETEKAQQTKNKRKK